MAATLKFIFILGSGEISSVPQDPRLGRHPESPTGQLETDDQITLPSDADDQIPLPSAATDIDDQIPLPSDATDADDQGGIWAQCPHHS